MIYQLNFFYSNIRKGTRYKHKIRCIGLQVIKILIFEYNVFQLDGNKHINTDIPKQNQVESG
jgi:hypothetical protein